MEILHFDHIKLSCDLYDMAFFNHTSFIVADLNVHHIILKTKPCIYSWFFLLRLRFNWRWFYELIESWEKAENMFEFFFVPLFIIRLRFTNKSFKSLTYRLLQINFQTCNMVEYLVKSALIILYTLIETFTFSILFKTYTSRTQHNIHNFSRSRVRYQALAPVC